MSRLGLAVRPRSAGKRVDAGSTPSFGSPFSSNIVIYGHCLSDFVQHNFINETLKWLTSLAHVDAEIILMQGDWCIGQTEPILVTLVIIMTTRSYVAWSYVGSHLPI